MALKSKWLIASTLIIVIACSAFFAGWQYQANSGTTPDRDTLFQLAAFNTFSTGKYASAMPYSELEKHGDFGIGTFDGLDGEMIALNGEFYQIPSTGIPRKAELTQTAPYATINYFEADRTFTVTGLNFTKLKTYLDSQIDTSKDVIYGIKVSGTFDCTGLIVTVSSAQPSAGVKSGDWIEYAVSSTGSPMQGHDVTWARMEILNVEGTNISVTITSRFSDSSTDTTNHILNLQTGQLIDNFIIPANLKVGETFLDENLGEVMITQVEQRIYSGAQRTVISASVGNNTYFWDQATGVSVEGNSKGSDWTIHTVVSDTNIWQPDAQLDWVAIGLVAVIVLIFVLVTVIVAMSYLEKDQNKKAETNLSSLV